MVKVIALANQKGGVGKTTTAVNLGIGLATEGNRVLLLAADEKPTMGKYDEFIAPELLRKAFKKDGLDLQGLAEGLQ